MSKYLSIDIESTGLNDDDFIIEFGAVPVDILNEEIRDDLKFHAYLKCPSYEYLKDSLSEFVKKHNKGLIQKAHADGLEKELFLKEFVNYLHSPQVTEYFNNKKPTLLGKSLSALDLPMLERDFGRSTFTRKYFHHRVLDVSSVAKSCVDSGVLPEGCESSTKLAQHFNLGGDVQHTAIEDSIDVAKMYMKIIKLMKKG